MSFGIYIKEVKDSLAELDDQGQCDVHHYGKSKGIAEINWISASNGAH